MLTLAEIQAAILKAANRQPITRANYAHLADRVLPPGNLPLATARAIELPEWVVYRESSLMRTDDWLDLACHRAAVNQVKQAAARVLQPHDPAHTERH